ncbi:phytoene desaturase family protein [Streptomyces atratus]|uniref:phytoene desaturase family protein n=1 Tax=Streptomyces TaxID=1883 RepID=UPI0037A23549
MTRADVAVVGSGPNGLAAAVTMARAGLTVHVHEQAATVGGGLRGEALFDSEVWHDLCAAVHPMAAASAFPGLAARGVALRQPPIAYAHPLDGDAAAFAYHDLTETCDRLGPDGRRWRRLMAPLVRHSTGVTDFLLSGQRSQASVNSSPLSPGGRIPCAGLAAGLMTLRPGSLVQGRSAGDASVPGPCRPRKSVGVGRHPFGLLLGSW